MKDECMNCENRNKYFPSGCSESAADPESDGLCSFHTVDMQSCPTCGRIVERVDMVLVRDCYGIPYKHVCLRCVEQTEAELQPYPLEDVDYDY